MKSLLVAGCACMLAAALSGCNTTGQQAFLQDLQTCSRHYNGTVNAGVVGGGNFTGSVKIDCDPVGGAKPAASLTAGTTVGSAAPAS